MVSELVQLGERIIKAVWRWRFSIPRPAFGAMVAGGVPLAVWGGSLELILAGAGAGILGLSGLANWRHYSAPQSLLIVPLFAGPEAERGNPRDIQRIVVTTLRDRIGALLPPYWIRSMPVVVGPDQVDFAHRLLKRVRATYLLYGESRPRQDAGYQVFARLAVRSSPTIEHWDGFTKDKTPQRTIWHTLTERLTSELEVTDVEYPFEFSNEIEALVRSLEGAVYGFAYRWDLAEHALSGALNVAPDSESSAIDHIRMNLADALFRQGKHEEAIAVLRARAAQESAAPDLLRGLAGFLTRLHDPLNPFLHGPEAGREQEAVELLRRAASNRGDPLRPMTLYNLAILLLQHDETRQEAFAILDQLRRSRTHYAKAWYIRRSVGVEHWHRAVELTSQGNRAAAKREFALAGKWYSRAIRARPRFRIGHRGRHFQLHRFQRSAVLHANALDAHREAGHGLRTHYHRWRFHRRRKTLLDEALAGAREGDWSKAYANFDWQIAGYNDFPELVARVGRAVALKQLGRDQAAAEAYAHAHGVDAQAAEGALAWIRDQFDLPRGMP